MNLYDDILNNNEKISLVGLGYVGMPIAVAFANKEVNVIGFDTNKSKIKQYKEGFDPTNEVGDSVISNSKVEFTSEESKLKEAKFHIIAVPTPINLDKTPNLNPVESASKMVGKYLTRGSIVVYESTVYPGVTEDICIPILERESGLTCGIDFNVGYSPERINPGDKVHTLENIVKIVSATNKESLDIIAQIYEIVISAGVHRANSIKVAEAAKVVENSQRDINIAFMNELAMVFDRMDIDTNEVVEAMNTKWNSLGFYPGLVGGHCIGIDPYYFIYEAEKLGYHSQIVLSGRKINDGMGGFIADAVIKQMVLAGKAVRDSKVVIMGMTFKENTPDTRNSKVEDVILRLNEFGIKPVIVDPQANSKEVLSEYKINLTDFKEIRDADCIVFAVAHDEFKKLEKRQIDNLFKPSLKNNEKVIIDVKGMLNKHEYIQDDYLYWNL